MEILEQKLVIRDKTIERLKLELDEVTKLNELLEKKLNEHTKIEPTPKKIPTPKKDTTGGRCEVRLWGPTNHCPFNRCAKKGFKGLNWDGVCCNAHQNKLQPSNKDKHILTPVLGWWFNPAPKNWNDYSMTGIPKGWDNKSCNGKIDDPTEYKI